MADDVKKEEEVTTTEEKKDGIFSGFTSKKGKKKTTAADVDGTQNMQEVDELVTAKMIDEPPPEELVKAKEEKAVEQKLKEPSKVIKKDIDSEKPVYRKSKQFYLTGRGGGSKYFNR